MARKNCSVERIFREVTLTHISCTYLIFGPVAEFSSFANFEEKKRKSNLLMSFLKIVNQIGSFRQIRKNSLFCFCRPILYIFGFTLLSVAVIDKKCLNCYDHDLTATCMKQSL